MHLTSITQLYELFKKHPLVTTDSRSCEGSPIFFALKGENFNANSFALSALENGCSYAVVDEAKYAVGKRFILVDDVLATLQKLAQFHRQELGTKLIGISGTNGKTTTKELIANVLKEKYNILYTEGNLNNHIGVPLTLLKLNREHEIAVVEMGANHEGEIKFLARLAAPDFAILSNVGKAHLEGFGSFDGVKRAKKELYDFIALSGGIAFVNATNPLLMEMASAAGLLTKEDRTIKYALSAMNDEALCAGTVIDCSPFLNMSCNTAQGEFKLATHLIGAYNAENVLAACAIGSYFSLSNEELKRGIESYMPQNSRSQLIETKNNSLIVDAYNANPSSMALAIENFSEFKAENKMLILGDMRELGKESQEEHRKIIHLLENKEIDNIFLVGPLFKEVNQAYLSFETTEALSEYLKTHKVEHQTVLIKGSRGIRLETIIECL